MRSFVVPMMFIALGSVSLVACSADSTPSTLGGRLEITAPSNGTSVAKPADNKLPVTFDTNYVLKNPGTCNGQTSCGSVYLLVDGTNCNATGKSWNTLATSSPMSVDLGLCSMALGAHTISAELRGDDGNFIETSVTREPITSKVTITVTH